MTTIRQPASILLWAVALLSAMAWSAQDVPKGYAEVPKEQLKGLTFVVPDGSCSLTAPGPDWKWLVGGDEQHRNYSCFNTRTGISHTVGIGRVKKEINERVRNETQASTRKACEAGGFKVSNEKWEAAAAPVPGKTWRLTYDMTAGGVTMKVTICLVQTAEHTLVTLQNAAPAGSDSKTFDRFVASLTVTEGK